MKEYTEKQIINALSKIFAAEINDRLPFESDKNIYKFLVKHVYAIKQDGGYYLSDYGRMFYCQNCKGPKINV